VLADLRPNTAMLAELEELFGPDAAVSAAAGAVSQEWRAARVLAPATLGLDGALTDVDDPAARTALERAHAALLAEHGMAHLDISEVRSRTRVVTQHIGRALYEAGAAGVRFGSNLDDRPCFAVFEARGRLVAVPAEPPLRLTTDLAILVQVCAEYGLHLT
jgi:RES domain